MCIFYWFTIKLILNFIDWKAKLILHNYYFEQVTVSGDGLIHEVLNGLFDRVDWREALARLPIGVVPGGTGNALSRTLVHEQV